MSAPLALQKQGSRKRSDLGLLAFLKQQGNKYNCNLTVTNISAARWQSTTTLNPIRKNEKPHQMSYKPAISSTIPTFISLEDLT